MAVYYVINKVKQYIHVNIKDVKSIVDTLAVMLLSRTLGFQEYGFYKQFIVSQQILTAIMSLGIPSSTIFYLSSEKKKEYLANIYVSLGMISMLTIFITPLFTKLFDLNFKTSFRNKLAQAIHNLCSKCFCDCIRKYDDCYE